MTSYIDYRSEPINATPHMVEFINPTTIECDYIGCSFKEEYDTVEDAEVAKEIHEESTEYQEVPLQF